MGGFSFGGKRAKSKMSRAAQAASNLLLELIAPGISEVTDLKVGKKIASALGTTPTQTVTVPTVTTITTPQATPSDLLGLGFMGLASLGQGARTIPVVTQQEVTQPTIDISNLAPFSDIQTFNTIFEKFQQGKTTDFENAILGGILSLVTSPPEIKASGVGGVGGGGVKFGGVEDIGTITSRIMENLPPQMQEFISNVFQNASPEALDQELEQFASAMLAEAQRNADSLGAELLSQFSAMGLGTSGSAINAMKQVALETAINVNAQIINAYQQIRDRHQRAIQLGINLMDVLTSLGRAEQANLVAGKVAELQAQTDIIQSQIAAQAQIQSNLIDAQAKMYAIQANLLGDVLGQIVAQSTLEEKARIEGQILPYDILLKLATGLPPTSRGPSQPSGIFGIGELLTGIADIKGAFPGLFAGLFA